MKFNGTTWVTAGNAGFSPAAAFWTSIAIGKSGVPYVAYDDNSDNLAATVVMLDTSTAVKNISGSGAALTIYPNPSSGRFNIEVTSQQNEMTTIAVTNVFGEKVKELTANTNEPTPIQLYNPAGIYFITAITNNKTLTAKIVVQ
jgi:hypothetical protein